MTAARNGESVAVQDVDSLPTEGLQDRIAQEVEAGRRIAMLFGITLPGERRLVAVLADDAASRLAISSSRVEDRFPSLTPACPQAHYFEREIFEQIGARPEGHPWLKPVRSHQDDYPFFEVTGEEIHEVAVGPVHAGIIDPGHFRLQCHGETVVHLEIQLGYQHRGVEALLEQGPSRRWALLAECAAGDTTIGHALAHAEVVEALAGCAPPPRAHALRGLALELERIASHVGDLGALGADIGYLPGAAWFGRLRGEFLNTLAELSGSRYGRGLVRPGGVALDLSGEAARGIARRLVRARADLEDVAGLFFARPSVRSRLEGTGVLTRETAERLGLLGPVARACGLERDVRADHPTGIFGAVLLPMCTADTGDVLARAQVRWAETRRSLDFLTARLAGLPEGPARVACGPPAPDRIAVSMVEGWRGEIVHVAITGADGRFVRYKIKDPSFQNWTGLALALRGAQISDFPLCNKSFNLSYAGHDL